MLTLAELQTKWEARRDEWRRLGVSVNGEKLAEELLADLAAVDVTLHDVTMSPSEAAAVSNYHPESITRLVRQGKIPNYGTKHRPRVRASDLPKKPAPSKTSNRNRVARTRPAAPSSPVVSIDAIARDAVAGRIGRA
jgi:hypothetical protein